jgi:hypothetical protein
VKEIYYASEILKIIEGGLESDTKKVRAYAEMLYQKLEQSDKDLTFRNALENLLSGEYKTKPVLKVCLTKFQITCSSCGDVGNHPNILPQHLIESAIGKIPQEGKITTCPCCDRQIALIKVKA